MKHTNIYPAQVIEAPNREFEPTSRQVFLAGGIVNCPDWQSEMIERLKPEVPAYIGVDPEYERAQDVIIQTKLARPEIEIVHSIGALAAQVNRHLGLY